MEEERGRGCFSVVLAAAALAIALGATAVGCGGGPEVRTGKVLDVRGVRLQLAPEEEGEKAISAAVRGILPVPRADDEEPRNRFLQAILKRRPILYTVEAEDSLGPLISATAWVAVVPGPSSAGAGAAKPVPSKVEGTPEGTVSGEAGRLYKVDLANLLVALGIARIDRKDDEPRPQLETLRRLEKRSKPPIDLAWIERLPADPDDMLGIPAPWFEQVEAILVAAGAPPQPATEADVPKEGESD